MNLSSFQLAIIAPLLVVILPLRKVKRPTQTPYRLTKAYTQTYITKYYLLFLKPHIADRPQQNLK